VTFDEGEIFKDFFDTSFGRDFQENSSKQQEMWLKNGTRKHNPDQGNHTFKILPVEDNAYFRQSLKNTLHLKFASMVIKEAGGGNEALRKVKDVLRDLVCMDIRLPGESGLEVTKRIKRDFP